MSDSTLESLYARACNGAVEKILKGEDIALSKIILTAEGLGLKDRTEKRCRYFLQETVALLLKLPYQSVSRLLEFSSVDVFNAIRTLCPNEEKLKRLGAENLVNALVDSELIPIRGSVILALPYLVLRVLEQRPELFSEIEESDVHCLQRLCNPRKPEVTKKQLIQECDVATAAVVQDLVSDELSARIAPISRFLVRSDSTIMTQKPLGPYCLVRNHFLTWTSEAYQRGGVGVMQDLFEETSLKREILLTLDEILNKRRNIFKGKELSDYKDLDNKLSRFRLNSVQFATIQQTLDPYAVNQLLLAWKGDGAGRSLPNLPFPRKRGISRRYDEATQELVVTIRNESAKRRFSANSISMNSTHFYPVCIWALNEFNITARNFSE